MNDKPRIPDPQTRARSVANMRETCRQLDLWNLELDELIAMVETDIRQQRKARLLGKYKRSETTVSMKGQ
ncbi:MAG: hypothetical protein SXA11_05545 [Cyanobacteriota bacterium]|nr:hypothetical protein [Cyanobacteriota bacterium]